MTDTASTGDMDAIKNLKARYFRTLDTKDWDSFRELFTADFCSDTTGSGGTVVEGADTFVDFVRGTLSSKITVHHGHMPEIEINSPDSASGVWPLEDLIKFAPGLEMRGYGHYHEKYRRVDGEWRISYSRLTRLRMDMRLFGLWITLPRFMMKKMTQAQ